jgi:phosphotransferase system enzyme I (PtsI)
MKRRTLPSEEEQFKIYRATAERMSPHTVIIRTLDIGGDKATECLGMPKEDNPFLGFRAIRICLAERELFTTQIRALLRASAYGNISIMLPMISNIMELREANKIIKSVQADLSSKEIVYDPNIKVGIMIEVPAAAISADILIRETDFFSIGTNDLIQYTMAADRMNERVAYLYQPFNPSILRLIKHVIDASHQAGKWTGMCEEMAGDTMATKILLGLGLDEFSMNASSIPRIKEIIRGTTVREASEIAATALSCASSEEVVDFLN